MKTVNRELRAKNAKGRYGAVPLVAILLDWRVPEVQQGLSKLLDAVAPASPEGVATVLAVADELGSNGRPAVARLAAEDDRAGVLFGDFACRRAVVQAMIPSTGPRPSRSF